MLVSANIMSAVAVKGLISVHTMFIKIETVFVLQ